MQKLLQSPNNVALERVDVPSEISLPNTTALIEVLWRRRWTLVATVVACLACAAVYAALSTPVYQATARLIITQNTAKLLGDGDHGPLSESFSETQSNALSSMPVLTRALESLNYRSMKTFAKVDGDAATWLQNDGGLRIETARKSDVVTVSMRSPYADEAAAIADSIVRAYVIEQSNRAREKGLEQVKVLQSEKETLSHQRDDNLQAMLKYNRESGDGAYQDAKGTLVQGRTTSLASSLSTAEIATMNLRAELDAVQTALATPESMAAYVEGQQVKLGESGDHEYDDIRGQLSQYTLALSTSRAVQGPNNRRYQVLQVIHDSLVKRLAEKQKSLAEAHKALVAAQLQSAEENERQLRAALLAQRNASLDQSLDAAQYSKLEAEVARIDQQSQMLDTKIAEINVNQVQSPPNDIQVLDPALVDDSPVKPNKLLAFVAAMMAGCVLGTGLSLGREWKDARLRRPEEISSTLGTPVIAMVPPANPKLSSVARGQLVHLDPRSPAAEAYRSARTILKMGTASTAKTILIASPSSGDGKSTTASNLAIAFAQAGERTLLIDCDLRQPVQHLIFETPGNAGLSSVVSGEVDLRSAICATQLEGLFVLPCGPVPQNPSELLTSKRFTRLMEALSKTFDRIIIDSPPLMGVTDAHILAASADATVLVLRMKWSMRQLGIQAVQSLHKVGARVVGAIANDAPTEQSTRYYGGSWQYAAASASAMAGSRLLNDEAAAKKNNEDLVGAGNISAT